MPTDDSSKKNDTHIQIFGLLLGTAVETIKDLRKALHPLTIEPKKGKLPLFRSDDGHLLEELRQQANKGLAEVKRGLSLLDCVFDGAKAEELRAAAISAQDVLVDYRLDKVQSDSGMFGDLPSFNRHLESVALLIDADRAKEIDKPLEVFKDVALSILKGMPKVSEAPPNKTPAEPVKEHAGAEAGTEGAPVNPELSKETAVSKAEESEPTANQAPNIGGESEVPNTDAAPDDALIGDLVTLDQVSPLAGLSKRTLDGHLRKGKLPRPDVKGGGGKAHKWYWCRLRPHLAKLANKILPETFPGSRIRPNSGS